MRKAVFLLSAAVLAHEICLLRAMHIAWFGHAAALVVSVALLGFGVAATLLAVLPALRRPTVFAGAAALYAVTIPLSLHLAGSIDFNVLQVGWEPKEWTRLFALQGLFLVPFTLAALALWIAIALEHGRAGWVYGANLLGSGLGALLAAPLLTLGAPEAMLGLVALAAVFAAALVPGRLSKGLALLGLVGVILLGRPSLRMSPFKDLQALPDQTRIETRFGPRGRVDRVRIPTLHAAPGLSMLAEADVGVQEGLFVDGHLVAALDLESDAYLDESLLRVPFLLDAPTRVARLGVGFGLERADHVVEPDPILLGASGSPGELASPRSWLCRARGFDLIVLSVDPSDPLRVDPLLTVEGLAAALDAVGVGGQVLVTTRLTTPPRPGLRLLRMAEAVSEHVVAVRSFEQLAVVLRRRAPGKGAMERLGAFCERLGFDIVRPLAARPREPVHQTDTPLLGPGPEYPFDVVPVNDARPYFHRFFRWGRLGDVFDHDAIRFVEWGFVAHVVAFLQVVLLALLLLFPPLVLMRRARAPALLFLGLGLAFMLLEMSWLARATVRLGSPTLAAAAVIGGFLVGSGMGSLAGERLGRPLRAGALVAGLLPLLGWLLMPSSAVMVGLVALLCAFPLGMPFPAAIARLPRGSVAWAMAVNGFASVGAAAAAPLLASSVSILGVALAASLLYLMIAALVRPEPSSAA